jgi:hypothetical protein
MEIGPSQYDGEYNEHHNDPGNDDGSTRIELLRLFLFDHVHNPLAFRFVSRAH